MTWSPRTLINVRRSVYSLPPRFDPASFILFDSLRRLVISFFLFQPLFFDYHLALSSSTIEVVTSLFCIPSGSHPFRRQTMKSVHVCPAITLSFGLPYTLMRLRRSAPRRSRRIPERRTVEKLSAFSPHTFLSSFPFLFLSFPLSRLLSIVSSR